MSKFYEMGNGNLIAEANRGVSKIAIIKLQENEWARKQGGICAVKEITEPRAIYYAITQLRNYKEL